MTYVRPNPATTLFASDTINGVEYPIAKIGVGAAGSVSLLSTSNPLPMSSELYTTVGAEFTRPSDTTAYAAKDVVSTQAGALITFANVALKSAGSGTVKKAVVVTDDSACVGVFRLHLYHTAPTAIADNAPMTLLYADNAKKIGTITFTALATLGTGSTAANNQVLTDLPFACDSSSQTIYGILETTASLTPLSAQKFYVELTCLAQG